MFNREVFFPVIMIVLSTLILTIIPQFEVPSYQQDANVGAKFFPTAIVIAQILICAVLIIQYKLKKAPVTEGAKAMISKMSFMGLIFLISYAVLISVIGYLFASLVSFIAYLVLLRVKKPSYYAVACGFVFGVYYLFSQVFFISLPEGIFY